MTFQATATGEAVAGVPDIPVESVGVIARPIWSPAVSAVGVSVWLSVPAADPLIFHA